MFSAVLKNGSSSRKALASELGLTRATLSLITRDLIEEGLLYETGAVEDVRVGRREILLDVRAGCAFAAGLDVNTTTACFTILDLKLNIVAHMDWQYDVLTQNVLDIILNYIASSLSFYETSALLGFCISVKGFTTGGVCHGLPIKDLKQQAEKVLGLPVYLINNIKALAIADFYFGNKLRNFFLVKYGPGIGSAIIIDGKIFTGANDKVGELGHIAWGHSDTKCRVCGSFGCLESIVGFKSLAAKMDSGFDINHGTVDFNTIMELSKANNYAVLKEALSDLAKAVFNACKIVDPEKVLLAGEMFLNDMIFNYFKSCFFNLYQSVDDSFIKTIDNYDEKRLKSAGIVLLNSFLNLS